MSKNEQKAKKIYEWILENLNGWSKEDIANISAAERECDDAYCAVLRILDE